MKNFLRFLSLMGLLLPFVSYSQITMPLSRIVFQRGQDNRTNVPIQGNCPSSATSIQVKADAVNGGQSQDWTTIGSVSNGTFSGTLNLAGGWYSLQVRALSGGAEVGSWSLDRFGVGEVFVVAGQSNVYGSPYAQNLSAQDDRVSTLNYFNFPAGTIDEQNLPKSFVQAGPGMPIGPHNPMLIWGGLGDKLVARLGVPVLFLGAAYPGSSSSEWRDAANGVENVGGFTKEAPYRLLGVTLMYFIKRTGIRSILWHQGESDNRTTSQGEYVNNLTTVINKSRAQSGLGNLGWMISNVSYNGLNVGHETDQAIIDAQNQLISQTGNSFRGVSTDAYTGPYYRFDNLHFNDSVYPFFEDLWNQALSDGFFANSQPSQPSSVPSITTGYIFPLNRNGGDHIQVPFMATAPINGDNQYVVQLLNENGEVLTSLGAGNAVAANLLDVQVPVWADGRVRVRVNSTSPARTGEVSEIFYAHKTGENTTPPTTTPTPPTTTPTPPPPTPPTNPVSGNFEGYVDSQSCSVINGWVYNGSSPNDVVAIELLKDGAVVSTVAAGNYRQDLQAAGRGNGSHGYSIDTPDILKTGTTVNVTVRVQGSGYVLNGGAFSLNCAASSTPTPTPPSQGNGAPVVAASVSLPSGTQGQGYSASIAPSTFSDPDGNPLTYTINGLPGGLSASGLAISGTPVDAGTSTLTIRATDPTGLWVETTAQLVINNSSTPGTPPTSPVPPTTTVVNPQGWLDLSACERQYGWARDAAVASKSVSVMISWDNNVVTTLAATQYRQDLADAFGDNGQHGFQWDVPASLRSAGNHTVSIQVAGAASPFFTSTVFCVASGNRLAASNAEEATLVWRVFPNPTADYVTVNVPVPYQQAALTMTVLSTTGQRQTLPSLSAGGHQLTADLGSLPTGIYLLRVETNGHPISTLTVLKQ